MSTPPLWSWRDWLFGPRPEPTEEANEVTARREPRPVRRRPEPAPPPTPTPIPDEPPQELQRRLHDLVKGWQNTASNSRVGVEAAVRVGITDTEWEQLRPLARGVGAHTGAPAVLYALVDGWGKTRGGIFTSPKRLRVFVEVFADGTGRRQAWTRWSPMTAEAAILRDEGLIVGGLGGVPRIPVLFLLDGNDWVYRFPVHEIRAEEGSPAADTIRALHLHAALFEGARARVNECTTGLPVVDALVRSPRPKRAPDPRPPTLRPSKRLVRDAAEAEEMAAAWVRWLGWPDARVTPPGVDEGIDVTAAQAVAQVKFEAVKTGRPTLQALFGAGHGQGAKHWLFFSSAGYTEAAVTWADRVDMALFRFSLDGGVEPVNDRARHYWRRAT